MLSGGRLNRSSCLERHLCTRSKILTQRAADDRRRSPPTNTTTATPRVITVRPDQVDLATGIPRVQAHDTLGAARLTASVDILNANAHLGSLNGDGSRGENIGAAANLLGGEIDIAYKGWSLTLGVAASLGGSISSGDGRDLDGDGVQERCFAMSLGPFTIGECDEL